MSNSGVTIINMVDTWASLDYHSERCLHTSQWKLKPVTLEFETTKSKCRYSDNRRLYQNFPNTLARPVGPESPKSIPIPCIATLTGRMGAES